MCARKKFVAGDMVACGNQAMPGEKTCRAHLGGSRKARLEGKAAKTTADYAGRLLTDANKGRKSLTDLSRELAMSKAVISILNADLNELLKPQVGDGKRKPLDKDTLALVRGLRDAIEAASKVAERVHKMEEGKKIRLDEDGINNLVYQIIGVIKRHVTDSEVQKAIGDDIARLAVAS